MEPFNFYEAYTTRDKVSSADMGPSLGVYGWHAVRMVSAEVGIVPWIEDMIISGVFDVQSALGDRIRRKTNGLF